LPKSTTYHFYKNVTRNPKSIPFRFSIEESCLATFFENAYKIKDTL
jgi:hypothetical protein